MPIIEERSNIINIPRIRWIIPFKTKTKGKTKGKTTPVNVCDNDDTNNCIICFEPLNNHLCKLQCNHIYHIKCITTWEEKKSSCPICRKTFDMKNVVYIIV